MPRISHILALTLAVSWTAAAAPAALAVPNQPRLGTWPPGARMPVGHAPQLMALDDRTRTLYVANGNDAIISVVDADACLPHVTARCGAPSATVAVGVGPTGVALDRRTHTVYTANGGDGTVSVIDATACNARHAAGCARAPATVAVGGAPLGVAVNTVTHTVYVGHLFENVVSVIDATRCNASRTSGCGRAPATITAGPGPVFPTVDELTDTVYVPTGGLGGDGSGSTMAVIDGSICNAATTTGCAQTPATVAVGAAPTAAFVDDATHTVYVTNANDGTVSVVDAAACNGRHRSGCARTPATAPVGANPGVGLALDTASRTLYVDNFSADTLSVLDVARCNARQPRGCTRRSRTLQVGEGPQGVTVDPRTRTLYVADQQDDDVSEFDAAACSATRTTGCRDEAPAIATAGARDLAVDPALHTLYLTRPNAGSLALIDTRACNARHGAGCRLAPASVSAGSLPVGVALDARTQTLYLNDMADGTVRVIDALTCNVSNSAGCAPVAPPIPVGSGNAELALNPLTRTLYVANGGDDTVSVIDAASCNASVTLGCGGAVATIPVGEGPRRVAIDGATNTVYVSNFGGGSGHTVSVVDGSRCDAAVTSGCGQIAATVTVGLAPQGMVVDDATRTLYVANQGFNDAPGSVSLVDAVTCNGTRTDGCGRTPPTTPTPLGPRALALDPARHVVYTADSGDATASFVRGIACNAIVQTGCAAHPPTVAVGDVPTDIAFDPATGTVYVAAAFVAPPATSDRGTVSVFGAR
jgi:YVTN family beta-propeller protein